MTAYKKYLCVSLLIAAINAGIIFAAFYPRYVHTDAPDYVSAINYITGREEGSISSYRILKPMPILIGVLVSPLTGAANALFFENIFFYLLSVFLIYLLVFRVYQNEKQAFFGAVLFSFAYPVLAYGLASLTDLQGWFFFLLAVFLSLNFLKNPGIRTAVLPGLAAGFGMLFKESAAAGPIFFVFLAFLALHVSLKEKVKYITVFSLAFFLFPAVNSIIIYKFFSYSYLHEFLYVGAGAKTDTGSFYAISPFRILIETGRVFLLGWLFVFLGVWKEVIIKNKERIKILFVFLPSSLSFFLWIYPHNRMMFISAPLLVLLGSFGLAEIFKNKKIGNYIQFGLLFIYVLLNYFVLEFLLRYGTIIQPSGTYFG